MGLQGSWERSCGIDTLDPCVERIPEKLWKRGQRKQPGAERTSAQRWELQVVPGESSDRGRWVSHGTHCFMNKEPPLS